MSHADLVATTATPSSSRTTNSRTSHHHKLNRQDAVVVDPGVRKSSSTSSNTAVTTNNNTNSIPNNNDFFTATMSTEISSPTVEDEASMELRKKAAAEARKRRQRKINLSRRQQQLNSPRSVSQNRVFQGPTLTDLGTSENDHPSSNNNGYAATVVVCPSSSTTRTTKSIRANVEGMTEVAKRWRNQEVVAIPTECSYEACISLQASTSSSKDGAMSAVTPPDWAYRIECARKAAMGHSSSTILSSLGAPYCWVPRTGECALLQDCFPNRAYAIKDTHGKAQLAHRFNETSEVVQRIARQVWPGPVTLHVAVPSCHHNTNNSDHFLRSFWSTLTSTSQNSSEASTAQPFSGPTLTLRCPRHPLAIKALQKHMDHTNGDPEDQQQQMNLASPTSRASHDLSVLVAFPMVKQPNEQITEGSAAIDYCCSSKDVQNRSTASCDNSSIVVHPQGTVSAVLDGEDTSELFAVPTCEYGEPWHTQIWIHGPSRTVTLVQNGTVPQSQATVTPSSSKNNNSNWMIGSPLRGGNGSNAALTLGSPVRVDGTTDTSQARIKSAIRQRIPDHPPLSKAKQRIIQAVLCQWKVVEEEIVVSETTL